MPGAQKKGAINGPLSVLKVKQNNYNAILALA